MFDLLKWLRRPAPAPRPSARRPHSVRPELEGLEDRRLLSVNPIYLPALPRQTQEVFIISGDHQVYAQKIDSSGHSTGYRLTSPGQVKAIAVTSYGINSSAPELFAIGLDGQVYAQKFNTSGDPISGYFLTKPGQVKSLRAGDIVGRDSTGTALEPQMVAVGLDDQAYGIVFDPNNGNVNSNYTLLAQGQVKTLELGPGVSHPFFNNSTLTLPEVFAIGLDSQVYAKDTGTTGTSYTLIKPGQVKALAVGRFGLESITQELFVIGLDSQVYGLKLTDAGMAASANYFLTRAGQVKSLAVAVIDANLSSVVSARPEVFAIGLDDQVYAQMFDASGNSATGYTLTRPGQVEALAVGGFVAAWNGFLSGTVTLPELFFIGLDGQVYDQQFTQSGESATPYNLTTPGFALP
jgi:hypothetical protein